MSKKIFFRASAIGKLMTSCKPKTAEERLTELQLIAYEKIQDKIELSGVDSLTNAEAKKMADFTAKIEKPNKLTATAKSYIYEVFLDSKFDYKNPNFESKEMMKGVLCENDSLGLLSDVTERTLFKNQKRYNDSKVHLTGEPDTFDKDTVIDIKTSWSPYTFMKADFNEMYQWQLRAYMYLTDKDCAELAYCLVDCPAFIFSDIERRAFWDAMIIDPASDDAVKITEQLQKNYIYSNQEIYKPKERVKQYFLNRDEVYEQMMLEQLDLAYNYLKTLTLNHYPDLEQLNDDE